MKAYSFSFNTSDWLASPAVRLMSKAERGVYINLLALAWEAPIQGTLPASAEKVRRMAEMSLEEWAESGEVLLDKFPLSDCATFRYNPRLVLEREKQEAKRETNAEAGRRSAEKRAAEKAAKEAAATKVQRKSNEKATGVAANPTGVEKSSTISRVELSRTTSDEVVASPPAQALPANPAKQTAVATTDPEDEQLWNVGPLTKPHPFRLICERLGFLEIDFEHYRRQALVAAEDANVSRTINQWSSWIRNFFNNQLKSGPLLKAAAIDLTRATPRHEFPPEGSDCTGRHIVLPNTGDANLNRIAAQTYINHYPNATIHHTRP